MQRCFYIFLGVVTLDMCFIGVVILDMCIYVKKYNSSYNNMGAIFVWFICCILDCRYSRHFIWMFGISFGVLVLFKTTVYNYFVNNKVVKINNCMCWYYFYSPNMKYLTYTNLYYWVRTIPVGTVYTTRLGLLNSV